MGTMNIGGTPSGKTELKPLPMRIAMFSIHSSPIGDLGTHDTGGMSVYIRESARELGRRGNRVDIYTRAKSSQDPPVLEIDPNVRLVHLFAGKDTSLAKSSLFPYLRAYYRELETFRRSEGLVYDLIHCHYWLSGRLGAWARQDWKRPQVVTFHTLGLVKNGAGIGDREPDLRIAVEKMLVKSCRRILAATDREKEQLIRLYGADPQAIGIVPCGVDPVLFRPLDRRKARRAAKLSEEDAVLLYVGRFDPLKGIDRLIEALVHLSHIERLRLLLVGGDGPQDPEVRRIEGLACALGVRDRVVFTGRIAHRLLPAYYSAADVLALPSHCESFGLVALEALACGTPVVAGPVGAMERILVQDLNGRLLADATPQNLAAAIAELLNEPRNRRTAPERIRSSVRTYSWERAVTTLRAQYAAACEEPTAAAAEEAVGGLASR